MRKWKLSALCLIHSPLMNCKYRFVFVLHAHGIFTQVFGLVAALGHAIEIQERVTADGEVHLSKLVAEIGGQPPMGDQKHKLESDSDSDDHESYPSSVAAASVAMKKLRLGK